MILTFFIVSLLSSCKPFFEDTISTNTSYYEVIVESEIVESKDSSLTSSEKSATNSNKNRSSSSTKSKASANTSSKPISSVGVEVTVEETVVTDNEIKEPAILDSINDFGFNSSHNAISESDYYQYGLLNKKEKGIYDAIVSAISHSKNVVDTTKLSVSYDEAVSAFQKVLTDYPQFFYISRSFILVYSSTNDSIRGIILLYTDGDTTDEFDDDLSLVKSADRNIINKKVDFLKSFVQAFSDKIPADMSDVLKEKQIHDYILKTVTYDYKTAEDYLNNNISNSHAFDIYGAAAYGKVVCEGYSKLFQYLCYTVGINSTQVVGISEGENHMWNAVLIEDEWYHIDLTWDDAQDIITYSYFNLTDKKISVDHTIDYSTISVPECKSDKNSFINVFTVYVPSVQQKSTNYEKAISNIKQLGEKELYIYIEGYESDRMGFINIQRYIRQNFLTASSEVYQYILSQEMTVSNSMKQNGEFVFLTLIY